MSDTTVYCQQISGPLGKLTLLADDGALLAILLPTGMTQAQSLLRQAKYCPTPLLTEAAGQLGAYFAGRLREFSLPLAPQGTPFQQRVWQELGRIPYGQTISYGELARRVGCRAARAVGQANGRNPLPIVIPCHRVIAADGTLGGYSGGTDVKRTLLELEGCKIKTSLG